VIASSGTVSATQTSIPTIPLVTAQAPIRADVSQVTGSDPTFRIRLDASPQIHFPDFNSYWVEPSNAPIELSPELRALLAQDPIPDRSRIQALDHLLGKVFSQSALLAWAHNLNPAVSAADPGRSIVSDVKGITLASGYTTRAQWLAALRTADLAAKANGLFKSLFTNLSGSIPHGVTFQNTLSRPDFLKMVQQHQAWVAKNDPGFYSWQHKVEQQVQQKIDAENSSGGLLQILGLVVAAVVVIVLSVVSYGAFSAFAAGVIGSMGVSTAAGTAAAAVATTALTGALMGAAFGPIVPMLSTLITTGNFGRALSAGVAGGLIGTAAGLLGAFGIGQWFSGAVQSVVSNAGYYLTSVGTTILNAASTAVQSFVQGFENSMLGSLYQQISTGHVAGTGVFKQWGFGALLAAATAVVAFGIGDIIPWDKIGGPAVNSDLTQKLVGYTADGQASYEPLTVSELLLKPAFEGLAEYGVASALGVKDAEALGIGATAGAYLAPLAINGVRDLLGSMDQTASLFSLGNTSYNSFVTNSVSGQLTSLAGGIAGAIYDGNYQMGAYGASQVFTYNDSNVARKKNNDSSNDSSGPYDLYDVDEQSGLLMHVGTVPDLSYNAPIAFDQGINHFQSGMSRDDFTMATAKPGDFIFLNGGVPDSVPLVSTGQNSILPGDSWGYKEIYASGMIDYSSAGKSLTIGSDNFTVFDSDNKILSFQRGVSDLVNGVVAFAGGASDLPSLQGGTPPTNVNPVDQNATGAQQNVQTAQQFQFNSGPESETIDVTARLTQHLNDAIDTFNARGFTDAQADALINNPGLEAAFRGSQIDSIFKESVAADPDLTQLELTPRFKFGPDVFDPETQQWWDVTTSDQWSKHVDKYWLFGEGTPLFTK